MLRYRRIALTAKPSLTQKEETLTAVVDVLRLQGAEITVDPETLGDVSLLRAFPPYAPEDEIDLLLVVGGDGTILRSVRQLHDLSVPILSINRGLVGFLTELAVEEIGSVLPRLLAGEGIIENRRLLCIEAMRGEECLMQTHVLNEAAISQGGIARLLNVRTCIDGTPLATFHADGLIIATPTGSTAYSLAAGGPVVHPLLDAVILTPINPHSLTQKPIVIPGKSVVETELLSPSGTHVPASVNLTLDGQEYIELTGGDRVIIRAHDHSAHFLRRNEETFYRTLRTKLGWG